MSLFSAFRNATSKPEEPPQMSTQQQQAPAPQVADPAKAIPMAHPSVAHPPHQHHEGATDLDLYRTFSPSEVGMWSWDGAQAGGGRSNSGTSLWGRFFGKPSS